MDVRSAQLPALIARLEQNPELRGQRVREVTLMAAFRIHYRRLFFRHATGFLVLACLNATFAMTLNEPLFRLVPLFGFAVAFVMMFRCEFRGRALGRQLNRPAAEQLARDILEIGD